MTRLSTYHATVYRYRQPVLLGPHRMMLRPREACDLRLISHDLTVSPEAEITWAHDVAGNAVATARFSAPTEQLLVESRAKVEITASAWPVFTIAAEAINYPFSYSDDDLIDLGPLARPQYPDIDGQFSRWAGGFVFGLPTDTLSLLKDIATGVSTRIAYQSRETEGTQTPRDTLSRGWGHVATLRSCSRRPYEASVSEHASSPATCLILKRVFKVTKVWAPPMLGRRSLSPERGGSLLIRRTKVSDQKSDPFGRRPQYSSGRPCCRQLYGFRERSDRNVGRGAAYSA
jgi:hypothetical protein